MPPKRYKTALYICQDIEPVLLPAFARCLIENQQKKLSVDVYISSRGGDVATAIALHDLIKTYPYPIRTIGLGQVMSAAVIVFLGADERLCYANTIFYLHDITIKDGHSVCPVTPAIAQMDDYRIETTKPVTELLLTAPQALAKRLVTDMIGGRVFNEVSDNAVV
jgi:ATP-dependent protease ClpP protease subunit